MITSFAMYIPFFNLFYILIMLSSLSEFISCVNQDGIREFSCFFSALIWLGATSVFVVVSWQFFKSQYNFTFLRTKYFRQLFQGFRLNWQSRSHALAVFLRQYVFIVILILFYQVDIAYRLSAITTLQIIYLIVLCVSYPFNEIRNNVAEISNEFVYTILIIFIIKCNSANGLNERTKYCSFYLVIITFLITFFSTASKHKLFNKTGIVLFKILKIIYKK